ncbi:hypothetical protein D3C71_631540 [compost metagenome]
MKIGELAQLSGLTASRMAHGKAQLPGWIDTLQARPEGGFLLLSGQNSLSDRVGKRLSVIDSRKNGLLLSRLYGSRNVS